MCFYIFRRLPPFVSLLFFLLRPPHLNPTNGQKPSTMYNNLLTILPRCLRDDQYHMFLAFLGGGGVMMFIIFLAFVLGVCLCNDDRNSSFAFVAKGVGYEVHNLYSHFSGWCKMEQYRTSTPLNAPKLPSTTPQPLAGPLYPFQRPSGPLSPPQPR